MCIDSDGGCVFLCLCLCSHPCQSFAPMIRFLSVFWVRDKPDRMHDQTLGHSNIISSKRGYPGIGSPGLEKELHQSHRGIARVHVWPPEVFLEGTYQPGDGCFPPSLHPWHGSCHRIRSLYWFGHKSGSGFFLASYWWRFFSSLVWLQEPDSNHLFCALFFFVIVKWHQNVLMILPVSGELFLSFASKGSIDCYVCKQIIPYFLMGRQSNHYVLSVGCKAYTVLFTLFNL